MINPSLRFSELSLISDGGFACLASACGCSVVHVTSDRPGPKACTWSAAGSAEFLHSAGSTEFDFRCICFIAVITEFDSIWVWSKSHVLGNLAIKHSSVKVDTSLPAVDHLTSNLVDFSLKLLGSAFNEVFGILSGKDILSVLIEVMELICDVSARGQCFLEPWLGLVPAIVS